MFGSNRVDTLYSGKNTQRFTVCTNHQVFFFHIAGRIQHETRNLEVRETEYLRFTHHVCRDILYLIISRKFRLIINNILQFAEEPRIDLCQFIDAVDRISFFQSLRDGKYTQIGRVGQFFVKIVKSNIIIPHKSMHSLTDHTETFLNNLFKRTPDRHDFAYGLHARTDFAGYTCKLGKVPTGYLTDIIIELWRYISRVRSTHLTDLVECIS